MKKSYKSKLLACIIVLALLSILIFQIFGRKELTRLRMREGLSTPFGGPVRLMLTEYDRPEDVLAILFKFASSSEEIISNNAGARLGEVVEGISTIPYDLNLDANHWNSVMSKFVDDLRGRAWRSQKQQEVANRIVQWRDAKRKERHHAN